MKKEKTTKPGYGKIFDAWVPPPNAGESVGCVTTSFTFSPAMFEEECLGRFVGMETNAAEDGPAYLVEREEKLSQLSCAAALVDQHYARGVRSLRWDLLSARVPRGILHAKISLLLWSNHARLIVGSANLTDDGYRRNQEVFAALDYFDGGAAPLTVLSEILDFLREAGKLASPANYEESAAVGRWMKFLRRVRDSSRGWGTLETPRGFAKPRIIAILTGPGRPDVFSTIRNQWPDATPPHDAYVISPFFDPPDAPNEPARQLWNVLRQRGAASVKYDVTVEDITGQNAVLVHAPESLVNAQPAQRNRISTRIRRIVLEENRPLHAKCLWLENERIIFDLVGSSNFTSAGLGLGNIQNLEANLGFLASHGSAASRALNRVWLPTEDLPDNVELRWQPRDDEGEDSPSPQLVMLPAAFADVTYQRDKTGQHVVFRFGSDLPADWILLPEEGDDTTLTEAEWQAQGSPSIVRINWGDQRAPSGFRVGWDNSDGFAWWPVNVMDGTALPPPDELKNLPLEVLINILTSAKPLHKALGPWLRRKRSGDRNTESVCIDPHKRVDVSTFLLQRTRRVSWALSALRLRLERPVYSEESLQWRLRGPVGALTLANAIAKEARSEPEKCFLLTELCLDLARVRPEVVPGSLPAKRVREALRELIQAIRSEVSAEALAGNPTMAEYAKSAFEELLA